MELFKPRSSEKVLVITSMGVARLLKSVSIPAARERLDGAQAVSAFESIMKEESVMVSSWFAAEAWPLEMGAGGCAWPMDGTNATAKTSQRAKPRKSDVTLTKKSNRGVTVMADLLFGF